MSERDFVVNSAAVRTYMELTKRMQHGWMYSTDKTWLREQIAWHTRQISKLQDRLDELDGEAS